MIVDDGFRSCKKCGKRFYDPNRGIQMLCNNCNQPELLIMKNVNKNIKTLVKIKIKNLLKKRTTMSEWINMKEHAPEIPKRKDGFSESYLVCIQRKGLRKKMRIGRWQTNLDPKLLKDPKKSKFDQMEYSNYAKWHVSPFKSSEVTHWMPLPEFPNE